MLIIRAAQKADIEQLLTLSEKAGSGMTTMPFDRSTWEKKLERCEMSFVQEAKSNDTDTYFLVLEDTDKNKIAGSSAIYAGVGLKRPFYSYKLSTQTQASQHLGITVHLRVLNLVNDFTGGTELGSLFLEADYRKNGNGQFLSRSRQMMLADFPNRFSDVVFAELRGWLREDGSSPFWDHLGFKFFNLPYAQADFISAVDGYQFISDLMPKHPVYLDLLPEEAQIVVGKVHDSGTAALKLLEREGFQYTGYIDIFDAGPCVQCNRKQIYTVQHSRSATLAAIVDELPDVPAKLAHAIISNGQSSNYRLVNTALIVNEDKTLTITKQAAEALQVKTNNSLRYIASGYPQ